MKNVLQILKFEAEQNLQKLRQPVDKDKWSTEPAVVNAFYNPNKNDIGKYITTSTYLLKVSWVSKVIFSSVEQRLRSWDLLNLNFLIQRTKHKSVINSF